MDKSAACPPSRLWLLANDMMSKPALANGVAFAAGAVTVEPALGARWMSSLKTPSQLPKTTSPEPRTSRAEWKAVAGSSRSTKTSPTAKSDSPSPGGCAMLFEATVHSYILRVCVPGAFYQMRGPRMLIRRRTKPGAFVCQGPEPFKAVVVDFRVLEVRARAVPDDPSARQPRGMSLLPGVSLPATPPSALVTGTEYERLLSSLRLKSPWALEGHTPEEVRRVLDGEAQSARVLGGRVDHGPWRSVVDVIAAQCRRHADRVALSGGASETTYARLEERTCVLAASLRARGIGRGAVVAVVLERGPAFVELAIAVWRVGAAYLPLAPSHPQAWREDIVRRVGAALVVGSPASEVPGVPFLESGADVDLGVAAVEDTALVPEDLAYIICTSGSTGSPS